MTKGDCIKCGKYFESPLRTLMCGKCEDGKPIDNMANIELVIAMTKYVHGMEERKYTFDEMDEELERCWKLVLKGRGIKL